MPPICAGTTQHGPCVFSVASSGQRAQAKPGLTRCSLCTLLEDTPAVSVWERKAKYYLNILIKLSDNIRERALLRMPPAMERHFRQRISGINTQLPSTRRIKRRPAASASAETLETRWRQPLQQRQSTIAPATRSEMMQYQRTVAADIARGRRRMGLAPMANENRQTVTNDPGLPPPVYSTTASDFRRWCQFHSWAVCPTCGIVQHIDLTETTLTRDQSPFLPPKACHSCTAANNIPRPRPEQVPAALKNLTPEMLDALRPLQVEAGAETRALYNTGYRQHVTMLRFLWRTQLVVDNIAQLTTHSARAKATAAYDFLYASPTSSYRGYVDDHAAFLDRYPEASDHVRRRPIDFIESIGLECALWPHLFWDTELTFTYDRAHSRQDASDSSDSSSEASEGEEHTEPVRYRSQLKHRFCAYARSSLLGYADDFHLLQFVYDLNMWTTIGARKNLRLQVPMRLLMKGCSFSPQYFLSVKRALIDVTRQLGPPRLFITFSPYEWSFPYHILLRDEMQKCFRGRLHLPLGETLHMTHVLIQLHKRLLCGLNTGRYAGNRRWETHLFHATTTSGATAQYFLFLRLEFQDGTRKLPTQDYHGSGRVHTHCLIFADAPDIEAIDFPNLLSATVPITTPMRGYVLGSQCDHHHRSPWEVHDGPSAWVEGAMKLHHTAEDKALGIRAYFPDIMEAMPCHQDVQFIRIEREEFFRNYLCMYSSKFSDSLADECLNDEAGANQLATSVLMRYHPLEPEMILQLFGSKFRQWCMSTKSGGKRDFVVPWPGKEVLPPEITYYTSATWARGQIPLLDFLRKTNRAGQIANWLKKLHAADSQGRSLEHFAREYTCRAEVAVSAEMYSRFNDKFYGQWLVLHVPFLSIDDFAPGDSSPVPPELQFFAAALANSHPAAREVWGSDDAILREVKLEGHSTRHATSIMNMVRATRKLVEDYRAGRRSAAEEAAQRRHLRHGVNGIQRQDGSVDPLDIVPEPHFQQPFEEGIDEIITHVLATHTGDAASRDAACEYLFEHNRPQACLGAPGTGKTTSLHRCVAKVLQREGTVLFTALTNQYIARLKPRYGDTIHLATCHSAFNLDGDDSYAPFLSMYTLVVVDEVSQLQGRHLQQILRLWEMADRRFCLVFCGDKCQMAGHGEIRPWHVPQWRLVDKHVLHIVHRQGGDQEFLALLTELRTAKPSPQTLRKLAARKAWSPPGPPTVEKVLSLLRRCPDTTILTCSRRGAAFVNTRALEALFGRRRPLVTLPADIETLPDNYGPDNNLKPHDQLCCTPLPIYTSMRLYITRNIRKDLDIVNGMAATVLGYDAASGGLRVQTATGFVADLWRWTDRDLGDLSYYPVRAGYAGTILKFAGAELPRVTYYADAANVPAAAYTALSRVHTGNDYLIAGLVTEEHFVPAL